MAKTKKTQLPETIIVTLEDEGTDNEFLMANGSASETAEQGIVKRGGVYVLKELINVEGVAKVSPGN